MKFDVLFSSGLGKNRGSAEIALPSTGTTNPMASSHSVIPEPGAVPDLVVTSSLIHEASLTLAPTDPQEGQLRARPSAIEGLGRPRGECAGNADGGPGNWSNLLWASKALHDGRMN